MFPAIDHLCSFFRHHNRNVKHMEILKYDIFGEVFDSVTKTTVIAND